MLVRCYAPTPVFCPPSSLHPQVRTFIRETIHTSVSGHAWYAWSIPGWGHRERTQSPKILGEPTRYLKLGPACPPATHRSRPLLKLTLRSIWRCLISQQGVFPYSNQVLLVRTQQVYLTKWWAPRHESIQRLMTASRGTVGRIPDGTLSGHFHSTTL